MGELGQEVPKEDEITEVQVPRPAHSLGKPDIVFNFRMRNSTFGYRCTTAAPPYVQQLHHWIFALHHCLPRRSDVLEEVYFLNTHLLRDLELL